MGKKKHSKRSSSGKSSAGKPEQGKSWLTMQLKPPEPFNFQEPVGWSAWIRNYRMFHSAVGLSSADEEQQISMLLYCMGQEAYELLDSVGLTETKRTSYNSLLNFFEKYFSHEKNRFNDRVKFFERVQLPDEKIDSYIDELKRLSEKCEWSCKNCNSNDLLDEIMLLKLITGINDKNLSKRLQCQQIQSFEECVNLLKEMEVGWEKKNNAGFSTETVRKQNTKIPDTRVEPGSRHIVKPGLSSETLEQEKGATPKHSPPVSVSHRVEANWRSSFSSGVETGDEGDEDFWQTGGKQHDHLYFMPSGNGGKLIHEKFGPWSFDFDSDEEDVNVDSYFKQKTDLPQTSSKTSSEHKVFGSDESWPPLTKPPSDYSPPSDYYHFSVSGNHTRKYLTP